MWGFPKGNGGETVTCIACGDVLPRCDAREYDKEGDRWERRGKEFEHLCKSCDRALCHQPRDDLEAVLTEAGAGQRDPWAFLAAYADLVEECHESPDTQ